MSFASTGARDLLHSLGCGPVQVTSLTYYQIPKAIVSYNDAFVRSPLQHYLKDTPDKPEGIWPSIVQNITMCLTTTLWIYRASNIVNTVDKGVSGIYVEHALKSPNGKKTLSEKALGYAFGKIIALLSTNSPQQTKRKKEMVEKLEALLKTVFGDRKDEMLCIMYLFTAPKAQGRGYASGLMRSILDIADSQQRGTFLLTGTAANISFYNRHGFETVGNFTLGNTNPDWHEDPVIMTIMARKPLSMPGLDVKTVRSARELP